MDRGSRQAGACRVVRHDIPVEPAAGKIGDPAFPSLGPDRDRPPFRAVVVPSASHRAGHTPACRCFPDAVRVNKSPSAGSIQVAHIPDRFRPQQINSEKRGIIAGRRRTRHGGGSLCRSHRPGRSTPSSSWMLLTRGRGHKRAQWAGDYPGSGALHSGTACSSSGRSSGSLLYPR